MSETIESGTLVVIPATQLPAIMAADGASDILAALSARVATHKADPTTTKGRDEIRNVLAGDERKLQAGFSRPRQPHDVGKVKALPLFSVRPPPK